MASPGIPGLGGLPPLHSPPTCLPLPFYWSPGPEQPYDFSVYHPAPPTACASPGQGHPLLVPPSYAPGPPPHFPSENPAMQYGRQNSFFTPLPNRFLSVSHGTPIERRGQMSQYDSGWHHGDFKNSEPKVNQNGSMLSVQHFPNCCKGNTQVPRSVHDGNSYDESKSQALFSHSLTRTDGEVSFSQEDSRITSPLHQPPVTKQSSVEAIGNKSSHCYGATSDAKNVQVALNLNEIFPAAMCSGLYAERFRLNDKKTPPEVLNQQDPSAVEVTPFGRVKRPLDIRPPDATSSSGVKSLNPKVSEFTPKASSRCSSFSKDLDHHPDTKENMVTALKPKEEPGLAEQAVDDPSKTPCDTNSNAASIAAASAPVCATQADSTAWVVTRDPGGKEDSHLKEEATGWSAWPGSEQSVADIVTQEITVEEPPKDEWKFVLDLHVTDKKRHKSSQTEAPYPAERRKVKDAASSNQKVINLQAEVCRLRAQFCLNELQRERFHLELDLHWWGSCFKPANSSEVSRTVNGAQKRHEDILAQIKQTEMKREHCLGILKNGRELLEVPNFNISLPYGEIITPVYAASSPGSGLLERCTANQASDSLSMPTPSAAHKAQAEILSAATSRASVSETSCRKKQKLEVVQPCKKKTSSHKVSIERTGFKVKKFPSALFPICTIRSDPLKDGRLGSVDEATTEESDPCGLYRLTSSPSTDSASVSLEKSESVSGDEKSESRSEEELRDVVWDSSTLDSAHTWNESDYVVVESVVETSEQGQDEKMPLKDLEGGPLSDNADEDSSLVCSDGEMLSESQEEMPMKLDEDQELEKMDQTEDLKKEFETPSALTREESEEQGETSSNCGNSYAEIEEKNSTDLSDKSSEMCQNAIESHSENDSSRSKDITSSIHLSTDTDSSPGTKAETAFTPNEDVCREPTSASPDSKDDVYCEPTSASPDSKDDVCRELTSASPDSSVSKDDVCCELTSASPDSSVSKDDVCREPTSVSPDSKDDVCREMTSASPDSSVSKDDVCREPTSASPDSNESSRSKDITSSIHLSTDTDSSPGTKAETAFTPNEDVCREPTSASPDSSVSKDDVCREPTSASPDSSVSKDDVCREPTPASPDSSVSKDDVCHEPSSASPDSSVSKDDMCCDPTSASPDSSVSKDDMCCDPTSASPDSSVSKDDVCHEPSSASPDSSVSKDDVCCDPTSASPDSSVSKDDMCREPTSAIPDSSVSKDDVCRELPSAIPDSSESKDDVCHEPTPASPDSNDTKDISSSMYLSLDNSLYKNSENVLSLGDDTSYDLTSHSPGSSASKEFSSSSMNLSSNASHHKSTDRTDNEHSDLIFFSPHKTVVHDGRHSSEAGSDDHSSLVACNCVTRIHANDTQAGELCNHKDRQVGDLGNHKDSLAGDLGNHKDSLAGELGNRNDNQAGELGSHKDGQVGELGNHKDSQAGELGNHKDWQAGELGNHDSQEGELGNDKDSQAGELGNQTSGAMSDVDSSSNGAAEKNETETSSVMEQSEGSGDVLLLDADIDSSDVGKNQEMPLPEDGAGSKDISAEDDSVEMAGSGETADVQREKITEPEQMDGTGEAKSGAGKKHEDLLALESDSDEDQSASHSQSVAVKVTETAASYTSTKSAMDIKQEDDTETDQTLKETDNEPAYLSSQAPVSTEENVDTLADDAATQSAVPGAEDNEPASLSAPAPVSTKENLDTLADDAATQSAVPGAEDNEPASLSAPAPVSTKENLDTLADDAATQSAVPGAETDTPSSSFHDKENTGPSENPEDSETSSEDDDFRAAEEHDSVGTAYAKQVMWSLTMKLKELYPTQATDTVWLTNMAEVQTMIFLQQLDMVSEKLENGDPQMPSMLTLTGLSTKPSSTVQTSVSHQALQQGADAVHESIQTASSTEHTQQRDKADAILAQREEVIAKHRNAMSRQSKNLEKAGRIQQTLFALNQQITRDPGNVQLASQVETALKEYRIVLDDTEKLEQEVSLLEQQQKSLLSQLHTLHPKSLQVPAGLLRPQQAGVNFSRPAQNNFQQNTQQKVPDNKSVFESIQAAYPNFFKPNALALSGQPSLIPTCLSPVQPAFGASLSSCPRLRPSAAHAPCNFANFAANSLASGAAGRMAGLPTNLPNSSSAGSFPNSSFSRAGAVGPFANLPPSSFVSKSTGPFANLPQILPGTNKMGPFANLPQNSKPRANVMGPFANLPQNPPSVKIGSFGNFPLNSSGANITGPFANLPLNSSGAKITGPFANMPMNSSGANITGTFANLPMNSSGANITGPFDNLPQNSSGAKITGPFANVPMNSSGGNITGTFANLPMNSSGANITGPFDNFPQNSSGANITGPFANLPLNSSGTKITGPFANLPQNSPKVKIIGSFGNFPLNSSGANITGPFANLPQNSSGANITGPFANLPQNSPGANITGPFANLTQNSPGANITGPFANLPLNSSGAKITGPFANLPLNSPGAKITGPFAILPQNSPKVKIIGSFGNFPLNSSGANITGPFANLTQNSPGANITGPFANLTQNSPGANITGPFANLTQNSPGANITGPSANWPASLPAFNMTGHTSIASTNLLTSNSTGFLGNRPPCSLASNISGFFTNLQTGSPSFNTGTPVFGHPASNQTTVHWQQNLRTSAPQQTTIVQLTDKSGTSEGQRGGQGLSANSISAIGVSEGSSVKMASNDGPASSEGGAGSASPAPAVEKSSADVKVLPPKATESASKSDQRKKRAALSRAQKQQRSQSPELQPSTTTTTISLTATPPLSPTGFEVVLPIKPVKISENRYAALEPLGPGAPGKKESPRAALVPKSLTASFKGEVPGAKEEGKRKSRGLKKAATDPAEEELLMNKKRSTLKQEGPSEMDFASSSQDGSSGKGEWQVSTSKKSRSKTRIRREQRRRARGSTPPVSALERGRSKNRSSCSPSSSSNSSLHYDPDNITFRCSTPAGDLSPLPPVSSPGSKPASLEENWENECSPFPVKRGMISSAPTRLTCSSWPKPQAPVYQDASVSSPSTAKPSEFKQIPSLLSLKAKLPSLLSLDVRPPYSRQLQQVNSQSSGTAAPQLNQFSFSKRLDPCSEALNHSRPFVNMGFLGKLVRNNEAANRSRESSVNPPADTVQRNAFFPSEETGHAASVGGISPLWPTDGKQLPKKGVKEKRDVDQTPTPPPPATNMAGTASANTTAARTESPCSQTAEAAFANTATAQVASSKGAVPKLTAYRKLCLAIEKDFPNLRAEDMNQVISEVKHSYGGHFHGKLFSDIMKDVHKFVLRDFPESLRSAQQAMPVFTSMNMQDKLQKPLATKASSWQQTEHVSITTFKGQDNEDECSICLIEFTSKCRYPLDCGHTFHKECIDRWVKDQGERTCPICRTIVLMCEDFPLLAHASSDLRTQSSFDSHFPKLGS